MLSWSYIENEQGCSLFVVTSDGDTFTVPDNHPQFKTIYRYLKKDKPEKAIIRMIEPPTIHSGELTYDNENDQFELEGKKVSKDKLNILFQLDGLLEDYPTWRKHAK